MKKLHKIGLGGGCHWCTEAVFQSLNGVTNVEQGYIASLQPHESLSEAVIVHYDPESIPLEDLIHIHLHTHKSTSPHSFRTKYRSAIYYFEDTNSDLILSILSNLQNEFELPLVTLVLPFASFVASREQIQNYYQKGPDRPFCKQYIHPKLQLLRDTYKKYYKDL